MAKKVLSMEIGQATTRVVEIDYMSKSPKIYQAFSLETPRDMVQDGVISRNEDFIISLKAELRKREIKTDSVVFSVSSSRIANREARIPLVKENKILPLITANAAEYFPVDMNQYHLVYNILGKIDTKEEKQYRLSLLAVPNDVTTSYLDLAHSLQMHIKAIDYVGNSVYQVVRQDFLRGTNAVIKIDEHSSLVTIVKDGEIVLQRSVAHGVNGVIENMMELDVYGENLDYYGATKAFTTNHCIRRYLNVDVDYQEPEDTSDEIMMSRIMLTENLRYLIGNIGRILEYYVSRNDNEPIDSIELVGIGADFIGLDELLSNELGYTVHNYDGLNQIKVLSTGYTDVTMHVLAACIGASMHPLQLLSPELMKGEKQQSLLIPFAVMIAMFAGALALFLVGQIQVTNKEEEKKKYKQELEDKKEIQQYIQMYNESELTYTTVKNYNGKESNYNSRFVEFLEELEQKMPKNFKASTITAEGPIVVMTIFCREKDELENIVQTLYHLNTVTITRLGQARDEVYVEEEPLLPDGAQYFISPTVILETPTPTPEGATPEPTPTPEWVVACEIEMTYNDAGGRDAGAAVQPLGLYDNKKETEE
ncbi:MAG: pilus assembly protein PilM [Lachnospiraceae bacterium]|nr:pilus assembly protein PilM [Lachnospiraceae bacterium]